MDDVIADDPATLALLDAAAAIAGGSREEVGTACDRLLAAGTPPPWVEELLLQSLLMVGWPRVLEAAAEWRQRSGVAAPDADPDADYTRVADWLARGERTCRTIYGGNYARLRRNVRALHPALEQWMVVEGYGRTLGRPGLALWRRELCTVAQCAVQGVMTQLHSHLRGAFHAGAGRPALMAALGAAEPWQDPSRQAAARALLDRVAG